MKRETESESGTAFLRRPEGRVAYDVAGDGPLVVCAPGMGDLRSVYRFLAPGLVDAGYRVATMDLRGHGDSDATFSAYDDVAAATDLIALVEELGGPAVLAGNSMSAGAAVWAAAEAPDLVAGLVLLGPFVREIPTGLVQRLTARLERLLREALSRPAACRPRRASRAHSGKPQAAGTLARLRHHHAHIARSCGSAARRGARTRAGGDGRVRFRLPRPGRGGTAHRRAAERPGSAGAWSGALPAGRVPGGRRPCGGRVPRSSRPLTGGRRSPRGWCSGSRRRGVTLPSRPLLKAIAPTTAHLMKMMDCLRHPAPSMIWEGPIDAGGVRRRCRRARPGATAAPTASWRRASFSLRHR
jgi:pimeloyl-ACP methyl ester carboxylesterase